MAGTICHRDRQSIAAYFTQPQAVHAHVVQLQCTPSQSGQAQTTHGQFDEAFASGVARANRAVEAVTRPATNNAMAENRFIIMILKTEFGIENEYSAGNPRAIIPAKHRTGSRSSAESAAVRPANVAPLPPRGR